MEKYSINYKVIEEGEESYVDEFDLIVVVDTHSIEQIRVMENREAFIVIDHHERSASLIKSKHYFINSKASSNTQNILWLLGFDEFSKLEKELIAVSIISDTFRFKRFDAKTSKDFSMLLESIDKEYEELLRLAFPKMDKENQLIMYNALKNSGYEYVGEYMLCYAITEEHTGEVATLMTSFADIAVVFRENKGNTSMSIRCNEFFPFPLNKLAERVAKKLGGAGGGHKKAAGAYLKGNAEEVMGEVLKVIKKEIEEGFKG